MSPLIRRILDISYRHRLSHIGSCVSTLSILEEIYDGYHRIPEEPVCLGNAHAALALYVLLEHYGGIDAEQMLVKHGIHATRDIGNGVWVSGGSLGQVETIAMGMALANRQRRVWLVSSDGGAAEGAFWETLMHKSMAKVDNLRWYINANGWSACRATPLGRLRYSIAVWDSNVAIRHTDNAGIPFLKGLDAHYYVMTPEDWAWVEAQP